VASHGVIHRWQQRARELRHETYALYFAMRDPRVPWYAKALAAGLVGYVFSPIDLIPDFLPIVGYLDELVLVPLGVMAVRAMIPEQVLAECRARARRVDGTPRHRVAAAVIVVIWIAVAAAAAYWLASWLGWLS
jgi:uncharacterized membrane protein YkvA (DUF1232 family)